MERLTKRSKNGGVYFPEELVGVTLTPDNATIHRLLWRLAAYEDTGLEPEEVTALGKLFDYALEESKTLTEQLALLNRIRDLAEADKDGRLAVLPCKAGDTVYILRRTFDGADVVGETELWWDDIPQLGKTVFLTREEAEKALEAMKDGC